jgi:GT2 family glycosyltransferase
MKFAAFIMTYKRPEIAINTINLILNQTIKPSKILIIDNDPDQTAKNIKDQFPDDLFQYYSVGYNSGPAGGAYWGLKILFEQGWEWVLWIDDDDPPIFSNQIEKLFDIIQNYKFYNNIGLVGSTGVKFNYSSFSLRRIDNVDLKGILEVDMIGGNQFPLVNRRVYESGILPNPDIFFGFEDLEFNLRVLQNKFQILINGEEVQRLRIAHNTFENKKQNKPKKNINKLWREYYSIRTILIILKNNKNSYLVFKFIFLSLIKAFLGFRYGFKYGSLQLKYIIKGLFDGYFRLLGLRLNPLSKY